MKKLYIDISDEHMLFGWTDDNSLYNTLEKHSEDLIKWITEKDLSFIRDLLYNECDIYDHDHYELEFDVVNDNELTIIYNNSYLDWCVDDEYEDGGYDVEVEESAYIYLTIIEN